MIPVMIMLLLVGWAGGVFAREPQDPDVFQAGIYGDLDRTVTCVTGQAGDTILQVVWAWVPDDLGLAYLTLRIDSPDNLDLTARPQYNPLVTEVIRTDYVDGTQEWNLLFTECPSGWVLVFTQEGVLLDGQPGAVGILGDHSMARDCLFHLNDLDVLNTLILNDPDCDFVQTGGKTWGWVKGLFR